MIAELGYESSLVARSLRSRRTNVIGILVADIEPFSAELLKGAAAAIRATRLRADRLLRQRARQGALRAGSGATSPGSAARSPTGSSSSPRRSSTSSTPARSSPSTPTPVRRACPASTPTTSPARSPPREYLIGLGHRRIGFLAGRPDLESARLREQGFRDALAGAGIALDPDLIRVGEYELGDVRGAGPPAAARSTSRRRRSSPPTTCRPSRRCTSPARSGCPCPDDVSVIGFDNIPESALTEPPLTTIDQSIQQMGQEAVRLLVDLHRGRRPTVRSRSRCRRSSSSASPAARRRGAMTRRRRRPTPRIGTPRRTVGRAGRRPARPDDPRGEGGPARQRLGVPARRRTRARRRAGRRPAPPRPRAGHPDLGRQQPRRPRRRRRSPTRSSATSSPRPASASRRSSTRRSARG